MRILRALLSAATLLGGHFLNRRLDRVVLIGALVVAALVALYGSGWVWLNSTSDFALAPWHLKLPAALVGAVALISAALTFRDSQQLLAEPLTVTMKMTGIVLSLLGGLLVLSVSIVAASRFVPASNPLRSEGGSTVEHRPFHAYVGFGGNADSWDLPAPPKGTERLRGRVVLDRAGVEGIQLELSLNGEYKAESLVSDANGQFEVQLPAGDWRINSIVVNEWNRRPADRDFILFSGHEPRKGAGHYRRDNYEMGGLPISVPSPTKPIAIELEFRDALAMTWPPRMDSSSTFGGNENVPEADISASAISWEAVEAATDYEVQISHVTREGAQTNFTPILVRRLSSLRLPLASLPQRTAQNIPPDEYSVHVYAFDARGALLTESSMDLDDRMFKLAGKERLGKEPQRWSEAGAPPQAISADYEVNEMRLSLAAKLIDQRKFDEAHGLLEQVTKDAPPGRAAALGGKIAALKGDCEAAVRLFDKAEEEGGAGCVRNEDRKLCEASPR